jgi:hypothetical protein
MSGNAVKRGEALNLLGQQWKVDPRHLCESRRDLLKVAALALLSAGKEDAFCLIGQETVDDEAAHRALEGGQRVHVRRVLRIGSLSGVSTKISVVVSVLRRAQRALRKSRRRASSVSATRRVRRSIPAKGSKGILLGVVEGHRHLGAGAPLRQCIRTWPTSPERSVWRRRPGSHAAGAAEVRRHIVGGFPRAAPPRMSPRNQPGLHEIVARRLEPWCRPSDRLRQALRNVELLSHTSAR